LHPVKVALESLLLIFPPMLTVTAIFLILEIFGQHQSSIRRGYALIGLAFTIYLALRFQVMAGFVGMAVQVLALTLVGLHTSTILNGLLPHRYRNLTVQGTVLAELRYSNRALTRHIRKMEWLLRIVQPLITFEFFVAKHLPAKMPRVLRHLIIRLSLVGLVQSITRRLSNRDVSRRHLARMHEAERIAALYDRYQRAQRAMRPEYRNVEPPNLSARVMDGLWTSRLNIVGINIVLMAILSLPSDSAFPLETIATASGHTVGYVIDSNSDFVVVLKEKPRTVAYIPASEIHSRTLCFHPHSGLHRWEQPIIGQHAYGATCPPD
jgi:hypothetical protein